MSTSVAVIIEDEPQIRKLVKDALVAENWLVYEADCFHEGLIEMATRQPDLLILDLGLPDGDGQKLIKDIRAWTNAQIIVLTARHEEKEKVDALDSGADDYICKPFGIAELLARIRVSLRQTHCNASMCKSNGDFNKPILESKFVFGDVVVDRIGRIVRKNNKIVHLTPIEYRLLTILIVNEGRVLTHRQLLKEVWGVAYAERGHYVRIYMGHLRQKLEDNPSRPKYFLTEPAIGYRLVTTEEF